MVIATKDQQIRLRIVAGIAVNMVEVQRAGSLAERNGTRETALH